MRIGNHLLHCCVKHGCKYKDSGCPIVDKDVSQKFPCKKCSSEEALEIQNQQIEETPKEWAQKLSDDDLCKYVSKMEKTGTKMAAAALELINRLNSYKLKKEDQK